MAQQTKKPAGKPKGPAKQTSGKLASGKPADGLPSYEDFLTHPHWVHDVYWSVIRKALMAISLGAMGLVIGYYRLKDGDVVGGGICWVGVSLMGSLLLKPSENEFEFIGRYNHFLLHPPIITTEGAGPGAQAGAAARMHNER